MYSIYCSRFTFILISNSFCTYISFYEQKKLKIQTMHFYLMKYFNLRILYVFMTLLLIRYLMLIFMYSYVCFIVCSRMIAQHIEKIYSSDVILNSKGKSVLKGDYTNSQSACIVGLYMNFNVSRIDLP
jgi:hypothetical protein